MKQTFLDFEAPIAELKGKIEELRLVQDGSAVDLSEEIRRLEGKSDVLTKELYGKLTPWQVSQVARHPQRPYTLDYIAHAFTDFQELHGDRTAHRPPGPRLRDRRLSQHDLRVDRNGDVVLLGLRQQRQARSPWSLAELGRSPLPAPDRPPRSARAEVRGAARELHRRRTRESSPRDFFRQQMTTSRLLPVYFSNVRARALEEETPRGGQGGGAVGPNQTNCA